MRDLAPALSDPTASLVATTPGAGSYIDQLRDNCGFVIAGIDWVVRRIRSDWDLIALIFEPLAGDFDGVRAVSANWRASGSALTLLGGNYGALSTAVPEAWEGRAAERAAARMQRMGQAFDLQGETCAMMSEALDCMLTATQAVCETVASLLSLVDDLVVTLLASVWGWAKEIATGGATVRRIIRLIDQAIGLIKTLDTLVPRILSVLGDLRQLFRGLDVAFGFAAADTNTRAGHTIDDVAEVGF